MSMDPLEPWVDAAAVRRMAELLMAESALPEVNAAPDAGFGGDFIGYAPVKEVPNHTPARERPGGDDLALRREQPGRDDEAEADDEPPAKPFLVDPPPTPPENGEAAPRGRRGPLLERLGRFREGLVRHTGAQGVFVLDREGLPVMDDPAWSKLHFLARSLAQAYRPVAGQAGNVHVKIGANTVLEVIPVETLFGCMVLGAVVPRPLPASLVGEVAEALRQAATPPEAGG